MYYGKRILVVDDEPSVRDILRQVLEEEDHEVTMAKSGEEAMEMFSADPFPLVITDIRMPGMNGIELLKKIKAVSKETQVIIITSHASMETAVEALRHGVYDYILKPFEDLDLIPLVVNRALEKIRLQFENKFLVEKLTRSNDELLEVNSTLQELAVRDGLTNLYNHRNFQENLNRILSRAKPGDKELSIVFFDVDYFKVYNDSNGHIKGDYLLKEIATVIMDNIRATDYAARYGGEEFVVMLPEANKEQALRVAENLRKLIQEYPFDGRESQPEGSITISIGVSTYPEDGESASKLLKYADDALYKAKESGRNCVIGKL